MATLVATATSSSFEITPAGPTAARCIDVVDLGVQEINWQGQVKMQHKIDIYWVTPHEKSDGSTLLTAKQRYTLSLSEKSNLYRDLVAWRGKAFTAEELSGFDIEKLIGAPVYFNIVHRESGGKTYANPTSLMPLPKGLEAPAVPADYVRHIERDPSMDQRSPNYQPYNPSGNNSAPQQPQNQPATNTADSFEPDDDLPF